MYIPASFAETDRETLHAFMRKHSFALLISQHDDAPFASHLPFLLDGDIGEHGRLVGHLARANPHWRQADGQEVLIVFAGPHAYVSPSWYEEPDVVPTWNYTAVHAYGRFRAIHDETEMLEIVRRTVDLYESSRPQPWQFDSNSAFNGRLVKAIVGFHIDISRIEGKWKLSQNHSDQRQEKVMAALESSPNAEDKQVAQLMRERL